MPAKNILPILTVLVLVSVVLVDLNSQALAQEAQVLSDLSQDLAAGVANPAPEQKTIVQIEQPEATVVNNQGSATPTKPEDVLAPEVAKQPASQIINSNLPVSEEVTPATIIPNETPLPSSSPTDNTLPSLTPESLSSPAPSLNSSPSPVGQQTTSPPSSEPPATATPNNQVNQPNSIPVPDIHSIPDDNAATPASTDTSNSSSTTTGSSGDNASPVQGVSIHKNVFQRLLEKLFESR